MPRITEDDPRWNPYTMGNKRAGPNYKPPKGIRMPGLGDLPRALLPGKKKNEAGVGDVMRSLAGQLVGGRKKGAVKTAGVGRPQRITPGTPSPNRKMPPKPITTGTSSQEARKILRPKTDKGQTAGQRRAIYAGLQKDLENP